MLSAVKVIASPHNNTVTTHRLQDKDTKIDMILVRQDTSYTEQDSVALEHLVACRKAVLQ